MKTFTIGTNDANQRFDKYLKKLLPNASVSFLYKMLRKKNITLDGKKATGKETLQKGAQVAVFFSDETLHKFMQDTKKLQECILSGVKMTAKNGANQTLTITNAGSIGYDIYLGANALYSIFGC